MCEFKEFLWCICNHHTMSKEQCDKQKWKRRGSSAARRISNVSRPSISTLGRKMSFSSQSSAAKDIERVGTNTTSSTTASNRSSSSDGAFCNPRDRKIRLTYMSDICPSCVATFREAGIGHVYAQEKVRDWNIKNNYSGPIKLAVAANGFVSIVGYTPEEIAELGRVHTGQTDSTNTAITTNTSNSANASRETSPERRQRANSTPWRRDTEREAADAFPDPEDFANAFHDIELDENIDAAKQKEKRYADYVRQVGSNDAEEERKEKEHKKTAGAEEERKEKESKERERKKMELQTQRRAELFAQADPRGFGDSDFSVRGMGDVRTTRRAVQTALPPRTGPIRANTMEVDKRRDRRPVPAPVRAKTSFPYSNRVPAPRGPTKPKVKTRKGDAYGDAYDDENDGGEWGDDDEQGVQLHDWMRVQQPQRRPTNRIFEQNNHRDNEERRGMSRQAQRRPTNDIVRQLSSEDNENEQQGRGVSRRYQAEQISSYNRLHHLSFENDGQRDQERGMMRRQTQGWPVNGRVQDLDEDKEYDQEQEFEMSKGQTQRRKVPSRTREMNNDNNDEAQERGMARRQSQPVMLSSKDVLVGRMENESRPQLVERNTHAAAFKHHLMTEEQAEKSTTSNAVLAGTSLADLRPQLEERNAYAAEPRRHLMTDEEELQQARNILMSGTALADARPYLSERDTCNDAYGDGCGFGRQLTSSPQEMRSPFDAGDGVTPTRANFRADDLLSEREREGRGRELTSLAQRSPIPELGTPTLTNAPGSRFEQRPLSVYGISAPLTTCRETACGETSWTV